jgi:hypothetical protein
MRRTLAVSSNSSVQDMESIQTTELLGEGTFGKVGLSLAGWVWSCYAVLYDVVCDVCCVCTHVMNSRVLHRSCCGSSVDNSSVKQHVNSEVPLLILRL